MKTMCSQKAQVLPFVPFIQEEMDRGGRQPPLPQSPSRTELQQFVQRFADSGELHHTCPPDEDCERCAFERVGMMLIEQWEAECL
jgi:hypothetical protein